MFKGHQGNISGIEEAESILNDYVKSGTYGLFIRTGEESLGIKEILKMFLWLVNCKKEEYQDGRFVYWDGCSGLTYLTIDDTIKLKKVLDNPQNRKSALDIIRSMASAEKGTNNVFDALKNLNQKVRQTEPLKGIVCCFVDAHCDLNQPLVWRELKDCLRMGMAAKMTLCFVSYDFKIPKEIADDVKVIDLPLPTREEINQTIIGTIELHRALVLKQNPSAEYKVPEDLEPFVNVLLGLNSSQINQALSRTYNVKGELDVKILGKVKSELLCNDGFLHYHEYTVRSDDVGGMKVFMNWLKDRAPAYTIEGQEYGLEFIKAILFVGVPGCGKSLTAKAVAGILNMPLLQLDFGKIFASLVGESEANMRKVLQVAESMAPVVLWIDEIEKAISGIQSSGRTDGGTTSRIFGTLLTWLQENKKPVLVVGTANNIEELPTEFTRVGRFDGIFFVGIPTVEVRREIFEIQLKNKGRDPNKFDLTRLAQESEGYTGAEIEQIVKDGLVCSYKNGKKGLSTEDLLRSMSSVTPAVNGIMSDRVERLKSWCKANNIVDANEQIQPRVDNSNASNDVDDCAKVGSAVEFF